MDKQSREYSFSTLERDVHVQLQISGEILKECFGKVKQEAWIV